MLVLWVVNREVGGCGGEIVTKNSDAGGFIIGMITL